MRDESHWEGIEYTVDAPPERGCYAFGLYIEGCRWCHEEHLLEASRPKQLFT